MHISSSLAPESRRRGPLVERQFRRLADAVVTTRGRLVVMAMTLLLFLVFWLHSSSNTAGTYTCNNKPFSEARFCDADGTCHEEPSEPSPRTVYSSWTCEQYEKWWQFHAQLNATAASFENGSTGQPLVLLGDSITEAWLGTGLGDLRRRADGVPQVLQAWIQEEAQQHKIVWKPLVLAISGDQTQHLLWRLQNGQLLPEYALDPSTIFVIMVGTTIGYD